MFQMDAAVNSGNSGGPVYNDKGQVVGVVTAKYASTGVEGLGFAIPINTAKVIIEDLIEKGYVTGRPSIGISIIEVTTDYQRFMYGGLTNHGWDGVMLAVLCHNKPQFMPLAALFLAYIRTSADALNFSSSIPPEIISVIQAVIIILVAAERFLAQWEHRVIVKNTKREMKTQGGAN